MSRHSSWWRYIAYLFVRLRANAQTLRERLEFEELIASISTQFINLPRDRIGERSRKGSSELVEHAGIDRAQIIVHRAGEAEFVRSYSNRGRRPRRGAADRFEEDDCKLRYSTGSSAATSAQGCI